MLYPMDGRSFLLLKDSKARCSAVLAMKVNESPMLLQHCKEMYI